MYLWNCQHLFFIRFNPLPDDTILTLFKMKAFPDDNFSLEKWCDFSLIVQKKKTFCEKEKMLVTSILSVSHIIFKWLLFQGRQKLELYGEGIGIRISLQLCIHRSSFFKVSCTPLNLLFFFYYPSDAH